MGAIHNVLAAACQAIEVPTARFEAEGKPVVDDPGYDDLAAWIARQAAPKLSRAERAELDRLLVVLPKKVARKRLTKEEGRLFVCDEDATDLPDGAIVLSGLKMYAVKGARRSACAAARLLGPAFLDALASELWRLDAATVIAKQKLRPRGGAIRASLWRGATGVRITHQIVQLEGEAFGLIAKVRGRWTWSEGPRDDILASVPDALMESAVAAVVGGARRGVAAPAASATILSLDDADKLAAVAVGGDGTAHVLTKRGRLGALRPGATELAWTEAGAKGIRGMAASARGTVLTWGAEGVTTWRAGKSKRVTKTGATGARILDDDGVAWWSEDTLTLPGGGRVRGVAGRSIAILAKTRRILAIGAGDTHVFDLRTGKPAGELAIRGALHALSPDEARVATWESGARAREVRIFATADGAELASARLDSGTIDRAVFSPDGRLLVRYHDRIRVAVLDAAGKQTHRIEGRRLGTPGSTVRIVFPLARGAVLAFASYPRGEAVLVDAAAQTLARWSLGTLYVGGQTRFAEGGGRVILTHDHLVQRVLVF